jgi:hypothetical protein
MEVGIHATTHNCVTYPHIKGGTSSNCQSLTNKTVQQNNFTLTSQGRQNLRRSQTDSILVKHRILTCSYPLIVLGKHHQTILPITTQHTLQPSTPRTHPNATLSLPYANVLTILPLPLQIPYPTSNLSPTAPLQATVIKVGPMPNLNLQPTLLLTPSPTITLCTIAPIIAAAAAR